MLPFMVKAKPMSSPAKNVHHMMQKDHKMVLDQLLSVAV